MLSRSYIFFYFSILLGLPFDDCPILVWRSPVGLQSVHRWQCKSVIQLLCGIFHWSGHIQSDPFQRHGVSYFNSPICYTLLISSMDLVWLSLTFTPIVSWVRLREILTVLLSRATFVSSGNQEPCVTNCQTWKSTKRSQKDTSLLPMTTIRFWRQNLVAVPLPHLA